jgi:hypothetical protein
MAIPTSSFGSGILLIDADVFPRSASGVGVEAFNLLEHIPFHINGPIETGRASAWLIVTSAPS